MPPSIQHPRLPRGCPNAQNALASNGNRLLTLNSTRCRGYAAANRNSFALAVESDTHSVQTGLGSVQRGLPANLIHCLGFWEIFQSLARFELPVGMYHCLSPLPIALSPRKPAAPCSGWALSMAFHTRKFLLDCMARGHRSILERHGSQLVPRDASCPRRDGTPPLQIHNAPLTFPACCTCAPVRVQTAVL